MVEIIAHRGSAGDYPENTMTAFLEAEKAMADGIEMDVRFTKDKQLVVIHDETVDRTTDGKGKVSEYNLADLKQLNAAANHPNHPKKEEILTLKEYLDWASKTHLILNIEVKYSKDTYFEYENDILKLLANYHLGDRLIISSFNVDGLAKIAKLAPQVRLGLLYSKKINQPEEYISEYGIEALHPSKKLTNKKLITLAKEKQIPIRIFTVNKVKEMESFFEMSCTSMITDYPELALKVRNKKIL